MFSGLIFPPRDKKDARKRLAAAASRCEGVYNRAGKPSVTFCGKEEQRRERALIFVKNRSKLYKACSDVAEKGRLELPRRLPDLRP